MPSFLNKTGLTRLAQKIMEKVDQKINSSSLVIQVINRMGDGLTSYSISNPLGNKLTDIYVDSIGNSTIGYPSSCHVSWASGITTNKGWGHYINGTSLYDLTLTVVVASGELQLTFSSANANVAGMPYRITLVGTS